MGTTHEKNGYKLNRAPWTQKEVESLTRYQKDNRMHPFTCGVGGHDHGVLTPTIEGWICDKCEYTQDWAHEFMVNYLSV
jgi:hypothetical protein